MNYLTHKRKTASRRAYRVRSAFSGTADRPRLSVNISNMHVSAQMIDDSKSATLVSASSVGQKLEGNLSDKAAVIGTQIAEKAIKAKLKKVVLDRGSLKYHGRVKKLAEAARAAGLEF